MVGVWVTHYSQIPKQILKYKSVHLCLCEPMCVQLGHVGGLAQSCPGSDVRRREWGTISLRFGPPRYPHPTVMNQMWVES